jgi:hypothetical protein
MHLMSSSQAAALASGVAVLICFAYECKIDGKWNKSPTAGAAVATILGVLFAILFAGGQDVPVVTVPPDQSTATQP